MPRFPEQNNIRGLTKIRFYITTDGSGDVSTIVNDKYEQISTVAKSSTGVYLITLQNTTWTALHGFYHAIYGGRDHILDLGVVDLSAPTIQFLVTDTSNNLKNLTSKTVYFKLELASEAQ